MILRGDGRGNHAVPGAIKGGVALRVGRVTNIGVGDIGERAIGGAVPLDLIVAAAPTVGIGTRTPGAGVFSNFVCAGLRFWVPGSDLGTARGERDVVDIQRGAPGTRNRDTERENRKES